MDFFKRLFGGSKSSTGPWPKGVPKLYPRLSGDALWHFMDEQEYQRLLQVPKLQICSFFPKDANDTQVIFGTGLQQVLIRNLILHKGLSVLGWEDTGVRPLEDVLEHQDDDYYLIGGVVGGTEEVFEVAGVIIRGQNVTEFISPNQISTNSLRVAAKRFWMPLVLRWTSHYKKMWKVGQPSSSMMS